MPSIRTCKGDRSNGVCADHVRIEQVGRDTVGKARAQDFVAVPATGLRSRPVAGELMEARDDGGVHVLGHHEFVAQVEGGRIDAAGEELGGIGEVGAVMRHRPAIGEVDRHAVHAPGAPTTLPIIGGQRGHIARMSTASSWPMFTPSSRVGVQTRVLTASESPLNRFSSRSRSSWGTMAVCSSGRSIE